MEGEKKARNSREVMTNASCLASDQLANPPIRMVDAALPHNRAEAYVKATGIYFSPLKVCPADPSMDTINSTFN